MFLYNNPDNSKETVDNSFFFSVELWINIYVIFTSA